METQQLQQRGLVPADTIPATASTEVGTTMRSERQNYALPVQRARSNKGPAVLSPWPKKVAPPRLDAQEDNPYALWLYDTEKEDWRLGVKKPPKLRDQDIVSFSHSMSGKGAGNVFTADNMKMLGKGFASNMGGGQAFERLAMQGAQTIGKGKVCLA